MSELVLGLDVGGTSTRALLADTFGRRLGAGRSGGGNPTSRGEATATANIGEAVERALDGHEPSRVAAAVMGIAGLLALDDQTPRRLFDPVWRRAGLGCQVELVSDSLVAFAAGTSSPDGTVVIAGTGAVAIDVAAHTMVTRADGYGWLLGDRGSGMWLAREAVHAALQHATGVGPGGPLVESVVAALSPDGRRDVDTLIHRAMRGEPVGLSRLAPLVTAAADRRDPVACDIAERAATLLAATVASVRDEPAAPIVLAGSLAGGDNAVSRGLRTALERRYPEASLCRAVDGAAGAAWLAARGLVGDEAALRRLHDDLVVGQATGLRP